MREESASSEYEVKNLDFSLRFLVFTYRVLQENQ
jgi:hypothetical protein